MPARANKPVSVTLGPLAAKAEARVRDGDYASISDVIREGLRALEREEALLDRILPPIPQDDPAWQAYEKQTIAEALADPRPSIPAAEVERRMRAKYDARLKRAL